MLRTALVAVLAALLTAPAAQAAGRHKPCPAKAAVESWEAKLYVTSSIDEDGDEALVLRGCARGSRRRTVLARWYWTGSRTDDPAPEYWLAGRYVAVNQAYCSGDPSDPDPCVGSVKLFNLWTGRHLATVPAGDRLGDIVLTDTGTAAVLHRGRLTLMRRAAVQLVDAEALMGSMAYAAGTATLYWMSGGQPRSLGVG